VCGVVVESVLDESPEYGYDDQGTDISYTSSFSGTIIDTNSALTNKLQKSAMTAKEAESREIKQVIDLVCDALRISSPNVIRDAAIDLAERLRDRVKICGKKRYAAYVVAVHISCQLNNAERELRTFSNVCQVDIKNLNFAVNTFHQYLGDQLARHSAEKSHESLISSTVSKLDISEEHKKILRKHALDMFDEYPDMFDSGRKPRTIISAILLINVFRLDIPIDVKTIASSMNISHAAISTAAREISKVHRISF
jgi:transcription initiation factor TFIIIB Brf1 subunit/transcription initiation factor TFIIB